MCVLSNIITRLTESVNQNVLFILGSSPQPLLACCPVPSSVFLPPDGHKSQNPNPDIRASDSDPVRPCATTACRQ